MTLLTKVAHDATQDTLERYISSSMPLDDSAAFKIYKHIIEVELAGWPQSAAEKKEIKRRIDDKLAQVREYLRQ